jgi:flagellar basal body rod protein FlgB
MAKKLSIVLVIFSLAWAAEVGSILFDNTTVRLEGEIKETVRRQSIIAHNIANSGVEGYQPIRFADELAELQQRPGFTEDKVIVEEEMAKMTKNRIRHETYLKLYQMKLKSMKQVMNQGK